MGWARGMQVGYSDKIVGRQPKYARTRKGDNCRAISASTWSASTARKITCARDGRVVSDPADFETMSDSA